MTDTTFTDGVTPIVANWLNEINDHVHHDTPITPSTTVHNASVIANTPAGNIIATNVQAAINELDTEKIPLTAIGTTVQAYDTTLVALSGTLTAANKIPYATALNTAGELNFLIDGTLAANSDTAIPSQKAVKTYVDTLNSVSGSYTPTATNVSNCSSLTTYLTYYSRVGNVVTVSGHALVTPTAAPSVTSFYITLPFTSTVHNANGVATAALAANANLPIEISTYASNLAGFTFLAPTGYNSSLNIKFIFQFVVV